MAFYLRLLLISASFVHKALAISFANDQPGYPDPFGALGHGDDSISVRRLTAAKRQLSLTARDQTHEPFESHDEHEFHYIDEGSIFAGRRFAARMRTKPKLPTLALEDIDAYLSDVSCTESSISLRFRDLDQHRKAKETWNKSPPLLVVTSHPGCNEDGGRMPHFVTGPFSIEGNSTIILSTERQTWKSACRSMTVEFGTGLHPHEVDGLHRRQKQAETTLSASPTHSYPTISGNFPTPSAENGIEHDLTSSLINKQIIPPDFPVINQITPKGISLSCANCSLGGSLEVSKGSFTINGTDGPTSNRTESLIEFLDFGYLEVTAHALTAHILLEASVQPSAELVFTASLPSIPLAPFLIPGIATIGPLLNLNIPIGITLGMQTQMNFSSGFDVTIPDGSSIMLNIMNATNSSMQGFDEAKISPLPFQASAGELSLTFSMGFQPELLVGIEALGGTAEAGAGFFFDLPKFKVEVEQVTDVDRNCEPSSSSDFLELDLERFLPNLTRLAPSIELGVGVNVQADIIGIGDEIAATLFSTAFPLPTACLVFDKEAETFGPVPTPTPTPSPTKSQASGSGGPSGSSPSQTGAAAGISNLFELSGWEAGRLWNIALFTAVFVLFAAL
ncbi:MAG: hypothetical protein M1837_004142 [Sclerophora amabilis]|nr:MAG: hypothetical protein M1837_004142 [Sclerophora amabilis]